MCQYRWWCSWSIFNVSVAQSRADTKTDTSHQSTESSNLVNFYTYFGDVSWAQENRKFIPLIEKNHTQTGDSRIRSRWQQQQIQNTKQTMRYTKR